MSETKRIDATVIECKDTGPGEFLAVASTPTIDHDGESLAFGCFDPLPESIPVHTDHVLRVENIVGRAQPFYDRDRLMLDGRFASTEKAQQIRRLVKEGMVDAVSVVFVDPVRKDIRGVRTVVKGTLKACDFVSIGANTDARLVSARSLDDQIAFKMLMAQILMAQIDAEEALGGDLRRDIRRTLAESRELLEALGGRRRPRR